MKIRITRKETMKTAFRMKSDEYSTFFAVCKAIAERFELPLDMIDAWLNTRVDRKAYLVNEKFILELFPTVKQS
jgi:hypothetical protein